MKKLILLLLIILISGCVQQNQESNTVTIKNFTFNPDTITIKTGTTIIWINEDSAPHTATAEGIFDSKTLIKGQSFSYTFNEKGTFDYICTIHPYMKGKIIVET